MTKDLRAAPRVECRGGRGGKGKEDAKEQERKGKADETDLMRDALLAILLPRLAYCPSSSPKATSPGRRPRLNNDRMVSAFATAAPGPGRACAA